MSAKRASASLTLTQRAQLDRVLYRMQRERVL
jgi:hypothetical protein